MTVAISYSGTAANGSDYTGIASVVIPAGSSSASFNIATLDDANAEASENFTLTITGTSGGNFEQVAISGTNGAVTTQLVDNDTATVSLTATPTLTEAGGNLVYTATISQAPVSDLTVTLTGGTVITILAGQTSGTATVVVAPNEDVYIDAGTLSKTITGTTGGGITVNIDPTPAVTSITDTIDTTTVTLTASAASVVEGGSLVYTATVGAAVTGSPLVISLNNGQTITIPVGQVSASSAAFNVRADDVNLQGTQTVTVGITGTSGGNYEALNTASTVSSTVTDDADSTTVTLTATASVVEGGSIVYTASVNNPVAGSAVTVTLSGGQTITIPVGASTGTVSVAAPADDVYIDAGTVSKTITAVIGGNYEAVTINPAAASTTVTDTLNTTTVSITGSASVTEGNAGNYTVSLTAPTQTAMTVAISYSGTAANGSDYTGIASVVIPAGSSSASFNIATLDD
ncbi:MAG: Calx-beta domain-containing protein, partial [Methylotenera sp.]|nr:Calx-beta domain-containing protein [Methylotenera sp.]